ncbi:hypothetical protein CPB84DRAFT_1853208 [Gymnopilus junonius]|uniref:Uncharacterized protein n=1 Tax=Gymnopilus junonius TaxID=109634 RepID=A0A9P5N9M4_GYMJU|nr:hypothetical protein CPB84DRAFT_1853208 [Gymnopilus junonius]
MRLQEAHVLQNAKCVGFGSDFVTYDTQSSVDLAKAALDSLKAEELVAKCRIQELKEELSLMEDELDEVRRKVEEASRQYGHIQLALQTANLTVRAPLEYPIEYPHLSDLHSTLALALLSDDPPPDAGGLGLTPSLVSYSAACSLRSPCVDGSFPVGWHMLSSSSCPRSFLIIRNTALYDPSATNDHPSSLTYGQQLGVMNKNACSYSSSLDNNDILYSQANSPGHSHLLLGFPSGSYGTYCLPDAYNLQIYGQSPEPVNENVLRNWSSFPSPANSYPQANCQKYDHIPPNMPTSYGNTVYHQPSGHHSSDHEPEASIRNTLYSLPSTLLLSTLWATGTNHFCTFVPVYKCSTLPNVNLDLSTAIDQLRWHVLKTRPPAINLSRAADPSTMRKRVFNIQCLYPYGNAQRSQTFTGHPTNWDAEALIMESSIAEASVVEASIAEAIMVEASMVAKVKKQLLQIAIEKFQEIATLSGFWFPERPAENIKEVYNNLADVAFAFANVQAGAQRWHHYPQTKFASSSNSCCRTAHKLSSIKDLEDSLKLEFPAAVWWRCYLLTLNSDSKSPAFTDDDCAENPNRWWSHPASKEVAVQSLTIPGCLPKLYVDCFFNFEWKDFIHFLASTNVMVHIALFFLALNESREHFQIHKAIRLYPTLLAMDESAPPTPDINEEDLAILASLKKALFQGLEIPKVKACLTKLLLDIHMEAMRQISAPTIDLSDDEPNFDKSYDSDAF